MPLYSTVVSSHAWCSTQWHTHTQKKKKWWPDTHLKQVPVQGDVFIGSPWFKYDGTRFLKRSHLDTQKSEVPEQTALVHLSEIWIQKTMSRIWRSMFFLTCEILFKASAGLWVTSSYRILYKNFPTNGVTGDMSLFEHHHATRHDMNVHLQDATNCK